MTLWKKLTFGPVASLTALRATLRDFRREWILLPNLITYFRLILVLCFCLSLAGSVALALVLLLLIGVSDWADGFTARKLGLVSSLGQFIDPLADRLVMVAVAIAFAAAQLIPLWLLVPLFAPEVILGSWALLQPGFGRRLPVTKVGKARTGVLFAGFPLVLIAQPGLLDAPFLKQLSVWLIVVGACGHVIAGAQYGRALYRHSTRAA